MRDTLRRWFPLLVIAFVLIGAAEAKACPNCKEAVAEQENSKELKSGYYYSILMMIGMPMTLLGVGATTVVRLAKNGSLPEM